MITKKTKKKISNCNGNDEIQYYVLMVAVIICMIFAGGFNWQYCIIPQALMIVYVLYRNKDLNKICILFCMLMLVLLIYSMATTKGDPRSAVYETEKLLLLLTAFLIGTTVKQKNFYAIHFWNATILAFAGVITYCFRLEIADFVLDIGGLPRLQSFIQYANTTACLLGSGYVCFLAIEDKKYYMRCFAQMILIGLYLTISKACIPIFVLVCTFIAWQNKEKRTYIIFQNLIVMVFFLPIAFCADSGHCLLSAGLCAACILTGGIQSKEQHNAFRVWCVAIGISALAFFILLICRPQLLGTFTERIVFMKDALRASVKNLFGYGTGSWGILQYKFQSVPYAVTYIHNGWLQFLFENGILFFLCILLLTAYSIYTFCKTENTIAAAVLMFIAAHSLLDFDFSFPSVLILFGMLLGIGTRNIEIKKMNAAYSRIAFIIIVAILCFGNLHMLNEFFVRNSFENKYKSGNINEAKRTALLLEKICPYDAKLQISLASISQKQGANNDVIKKRLEKAVTISPNNPEVFRDYMNYEMYSKDISAMCEKYIQMCPKQYAMFEFIDAYSTEAYDKGLITESEKNRILSYAQRNIK